ncbi:hypothetical protein DFH28DRAFT_924531 [Melampsora americana]|nr:hypothetical protein DFH28DRAFT_924531 [Melampsora americana]
MPVPWFQATITKGNLYTGTLITTHLAFPNPTSRMLPQPCITKDRYQSLRILLQESTLLAGSLSLVSCCTPRDLKPQHTAIDAEYESELTDLSDVAEPGRLPKPKPPPIVPAIQHIKTKKSGRAQAKRKPLIAKKATPHTHEVPIHLRPDIPAHHFQSVYRRRTQVAEYLHRLFEKPRIIKVDFDLACAYFLQHTHHLNLGDIPFSIDKFLEDFSILEPLTSMQEALLTCVHHIKSTLDFHAANPESPLPFALRYPNIDSLNKLAIDQSVNPKIVGKGEAVVFVDLAGRVVAVSALPKESKLTTTLSGQERGRIALVGAAAVNNIVEFVGPMTHKNFKRAILPPPTPTVQSPYAVSKTATSNLSGAKSNYIEIPGVLNGTLPSQAISYGRYAAIVVPLANLRILSILWALNYGGGQLILNYLGYAVHGGPGYSVHAAFDVLMHGVSSITCLPHLPSCPPQRICMAIYSHANVFSGAARYSGMTQSPKVFSDRRLWIPFYPADFKIAEVLAVFKSEEKRLHKKSRGECIAHHDAKRSAEAAALDL